MCRLLYVKFRPKIYDFLRDHEFEKARELYYDRWLGFSVNDLYRMLRDAGFRKVSAEVVACETEAPNFETVLASGEKPEGKRKRSGKK